MLIGVLSLNITSEHIISCFYLQRRSFRLWVDLMSWKKCKVFTHTGLLRCAVCRLRCLLIECEYVMGKHKPISMNVEHIIPWLSEEHLLGSRAQVPMWNKAAKLSLSQHNHNRCSVWHSLFLKQAYKQCIHVTATTFHKIVLTALLYWVLNCYRFLIIFNTSCYTT